MASLFPLSPSRKAAQGNAKRGLGKIALLAAALAVAPAGLDAVEYTWYPTGVYEGTWDISGKNWTVASPYEELWGPASQGLNRANFVGIPNALSVFRVNISSAVRQAGISIWGGNWHFSGTLNGESPIDINNDASLRFTSASALGSGSIVFGYAGRNALSFIGTNSTITLSNPLNVLQVDTMSWPELSVPDADSTLVYTGGIVTDVWAIPMYKTGLGTLVLASTLPEEEGTIDFHVQRGTLELAANSGLPIGGGMLSVERGALARLASESSNLLSDTTGDVILSEGTLDLNGHAETVPLLHVRRYSEDADYPPSAIINGATNPGVLTVLGRGGFVGRFTDGFLELGAGATVHLLGNSENTKVSFEGSRGNELYFSGGTLQMGSGLIFEQAFNDLQMYAETGAFKNETSSPLPVYRLYLLGRNETDIFSVHGGLVAEETVLQGAGCLQLEAGTTFSTARLEGDGAIRNYSGNTVQISTLEKGMTEGAMRLEAGKFVVTTTSRVTLGSLELAHGVEFETPNGASFRPAVFGGEVPPVVGLVSVGAGNRFLATAQDISFRSNALFGFDFDDAEQHFSEAMLTIEAERLLVGDSGAGIGSSTVDIRNVSKLPSGIYSLIDVSSVNTVAPVVTTGQLLLDGRTYVQVPRGTSGGRWLELRTNDGRKLELVVMDATTNTSVIWTDAANSQLWKNDDGNGDGCNWYANVNIGLVSIPVNTYTDGDSVSFSAPAQNERIHVTGLEVNDAAGLISTLPIQPADMTVATGGPDAGYVFAGEKIIATGELTKTGLGLVSFEEDISARIFRLQHGEAKIYTNGSFEDGVEVDNNAVLRIGSGVPGALAGLSANVSLNTANSKLVFHLVGSGVNQLVSEYAGTLSGIGTFQKEGERSVIILSGASDFNGDVRVSEGGVRLVNALTGSFSLHVEDGGTFVLADAASADTSGSVNIEGNGVLTIGHANIVNAAEVHFGAGSVLNIGANLAITSTGTVSFDGPGANPSVINITSYDGVGEKVIIRAASIVAPNGFSATANGMVIPQVIASTDSYITASLSVVGAGDLVLRSFLAWNNTQPGTFHGTFNISEDQIFTISQLTQPNGLRDNAAAAGGLGLGGWDGTTLTKRGLGELVLASPNSYTGDTIVEAGTLTIRDALATGNNSGKGIIVEEGATLKISTIATLMYNKPIVGAGRLVKDGNYNATLTSASTYTGETLVSAGTLTITGALGAAGDTANYGGAIKLDGGSLILNQTRDQVLSGVISGNGVLTKRNTNTLALGGAHSHTRTILERGNLQIGYNSSAPAILSLSGAVVLHPDARLLFDLFDSNVSDLLSVGSFSVLGAGKIEFDFNDKLVGAYTLLQSDSSLEEIFSNPNDLILTKVAGIVFADDTFTTNYLLSEDKKSLIFTLALNSDDGVDPGPGPGPDPEPWSPPSTIHDVTWGGRLSGRWNTTDANWKSIDGSELCFIQGDYVSLGAPASLVETVISVEAGQGTANEVHVAGMSVSGAGNIRVVGGGIHGYASSNGAGAFVKDGNGVFAFQSNTLHFEGGARVNAGTLILDGSSLEGGIIVAANSTLSLGQNGTGSRGAVTGRVENNGVITGSGILTGQVVNNGLLKPSGMTNKIEVEGSLDNSKGVIHIQVAGLDPGSHGLISYNGAQPLALGGTVRFEVNPQFIKANRNENTGRIELPAFLEKVGEGDASAGASLAVVFTDISIYDIQRHGSTVSFSQDIAKIGNFNGGTKGFIRELNRLYLENDALVMSLLDTHGQAATDEARAAAVTAITKASPLSFAALSALTVNSVSGSLASLHGRLESRRYERGAGGFETYFTASGNFIRNDTSVSSPVFDSNAYGISAGFDTNASKHLFLGLNLGGNIGRANMHASGGNIQQQEFRVTAYASGMLSDSIYVDAALFGGFASYDTKRYTVLGEHKGETDGIHAGAAVYMGGALPLTRTSSLNLTPYVGLEYVHVATDRFTEHGTDGLSPGVGAAYVVDSFAQDSLRAKIGTALTWVGAKGGSFDTRLSLNFAYARELLDTDVGIGARFARATHGNSFKVDARATPADVLQIGPSAEFARGDASISFGYNFETSFDGETAHQLNATFRLRF
ncbi:MAG: autotransporter domain-containing protein [Puniceicoccales bacterium]|nr:autotransporter domain-containing protein [Puniceicoccales bacterium]